MAGHSKWSNIKRKKEKTDAQKAKVFTKIGREIAVAVKEGGPDPDLNSKLRDIITKAKSLNVPNDNIDRLISKAGDRDEGDFEEMIYEGYGPSGVAVIIKALTNNRNRTAGDFRHYFDKNGGNLGQLGSVTFLFEQKGVLVIENKGFGEDKIMEDCIDAGAQDFEYSDEAIEITTQPHDLGAVRDSLSHKGYEFASAELEYIPSTVTVLEQPQRDKMEKLIEMLEDNDDVQNIWHSWDE